MKWVSFGLAMFAFVLFTGLMAVRGEYLSNYMRILVTVGAIVSVCLAFVDLWVL